MIRSVLVLACLVAIATAAPVNEDGGLTARLAPGATTALEADMNALGLEQVDLSESVASTAAWGRRRFGDSRRRRSFYDRRRRRRTFYDRRRRRTFYDRRRRRRTHYERRRRRTFYDRRRRRRTYYCGVLTHCVMNAWTGWTACSKSCGTGTQSGTRTVATASSCGGNACPTDVSRSQNCNTHSCPVDCVVPNFDGAYTACTKSCGGGSQHRTRSLTAPKHGGAACPASKQSRACGGGPCPIHCATSAFSAWTVCTKSCGTGAQSRSRAITTGNLHGGYVCPYLAETRACNQQACAVDCIVGAWRAWGTCSKSCATGSQSRGRTNTAPTFGGSACPATSTNTQTRTCNTFVCPIDGGWSAFGSCNQFCGSGSQSRTCTSPAPAHGGANCPGSAWGTCNTAVCPKAPKCYVNAAGETRVEYTNSQTPSFKCTHTKTKCTCTASGHPTHHKGGCQQMDHTNGKTMSFSGDCTSTGKN